MLEKQVKKVLEEQVNPTLAAHFGGAELSSIEEGVVYVKLTGACGTCPSAQMTVEDVIRTTVMEAVPDVMDVVLDTSVSEDMLDLARRILNHEVEL